MTFSQRFRLYLEGVELLWYSRWPDKQEASIKELLDTGEKLVLVKSLDESRYTVSWDEAKREIKFKKEP